MFRNVHIFSLNKLPQKFRSAGLFFILSKGIFGWIIFGRAGLGILSFKNVCLFGGDLSFEVHIDRISQSSSVIFGRAYYWTELEWLG